MTNLKFRVVLAGFGHVEFRDFFVADELNSLVYSFNGLQVFVCAYANQWTNVSVTCNNQYSWVTPVIGMLPAFWRFSQCLRRYYDTRQAMPHLFNAIKYFFNMLVIWLAASAKITDYESVHGLWIAASVVASTYAYVWDVRKDWGLLDKEHGYLRAELAYKWKWVCAYFVHCFFGIVRSNTSIICRYTTSQ